MYSTLLAIGGIGLVIFVHELGHYIAARLCGVRVETFSLGFGPRLLAWRRGPTVYQIAIVPLGGFCRMAGEERRMDGLPPAPDELPAKSVEQRFFIYSGGVLMNVIFGLVVFPILFHVGVPFLRPVIGDTVPGGPAWHAGIPAGAEVVTVNGNSVFEFVHIPTEVALGDPERAEVVVRDPATGALRTFELAPQEVESEGIRTIGVLPALERDAEGHFVIEVAEGSPAWDAGLRSGDSVVEIVDAIPGLGPQAAIDLASSGGERPLRLLVTGPEGRREVEIASVLSETMAPPIVGIGPPRNHVFDVRDTPLVRGLGILPDDRLVEVHGLPIRRFGDLRAALLESAEPLVVTVERGGRWISLEGPALDREGALALADSLAITQDLETTALVVQPGQPAARAGLRDGDRVVSVDGAEVASWNDVQELVRRAGRENRPASFEVERRGPEGESVFATIAAAPEARTLRTFGFDLRHDTYVYRAESVSQAVAFGGYCSWKFLQDSWLTLKRMVLQDVSTKNLGGIITIGAVSYHLAEMGWVKLAFFLCLLSINLAFINVLPIPVLDGGHLFFLIVEKIKGSPVSERVMGYSQMVGVVLILSLMVYVTYNDLARWVFPS